MSAVGMTLIAGKRIVTISVSIAMLVVHGCLIVFMTNQTSECRCRAGVVADIATNIVRALKGESMSECSACPGGGCVAVPAGMREI
jgi:hypothetical protein